MAELGVPGTVQPCHHTTPQFGCAGCIESDRRAFAAKVYTAWKATFKLPKCPECGSVMAHYDFGADSKRVVAVIVCPRIDATEGVAMCGDQDQEIVIG